MRYEGQIMSKDKYPSIFSPQMEAIVFVILQIFFATCTVLRIEEYSWIFPSFAKGNMANQNTGKRLYIIHSTVLYPTFP